MESYYGVIYFANGTKRETGNYCGPGAEQSCERGTYLQFEQEMRVWQNSGANSFFKPTRYEVKTRKN